MNLRVKNVLTAVIQRRKGVMTGSRLAATFGRILVEDAFLRADSVMSNHVFRFGDLKLPPFAWSDNVIVISNSVAGVAKSLKAISDALWETGELEIKDGSTEIVPASTRRHNWRSLALGTMSFEVVDSFRCLGYFLACNGDTGVTRDRMLGALRGALGKNKWLNDGSVPKFLKARWWRQQLSGTIGWIAPFAIPTPSMFAKLQVLSNKGARLIGGLPRNSNSSNDLLHVKSEFKICVPTIFCQRLVNRIAHIFRHPELFVHSVLSLPDGRLDDLRSEGRPSELSASLFQGWELLRHLGLGSPDPPSAGRPGVRGESGNVFRWGEHWFAEIRDGLGWNIPRKDSAQTDFRVQVLLKLFLQKRPQLPLMLDYGPHELLAISDG